MITESNDLHASVERLYAVWIESGGLTPDETRQLLAAASHLEQLYSDHINVEETTVFARAAQVLDRNAIAAIGTEFRFRRK